METLLPGLRNVLSLPAASIHRLQRHRKAPSRFPHRAECALVPRLRYGSCGIVPANAAASTNRSTSACARTLRDA